MDATVERLLAEARALSESARAELVTGLVAPFVDDGRYREFFELWQQHGFHITPNDHYHPVPDTRALQLERWARELPLAAVDMNEAGQLRVARDVLGRYVQECRFADAPTGTPHEYHFNNPMFNDFDPMVLHGLIRHHRSKLVVEVGSGYSTRVIARAAGMNGSTDVVVIDKYPGDVVLAGIPGVTRLLPEDVEQVDPATFDRLGAGDVVFVDTSHVVRCASEVNYLFFEVFPRLKRGVLVHIHDIFFPYDYPRTWLVDLKLFWTEQYLLQAFLMFNSAFQVLFCTSFMATRHTEEMRRLFPQSPHVGGTSFWMVRQ